MHALFQSFENSKFPLDLCTKPNPREHSVLDSDVRFLCLIVDDRWPAQSRLKVLTPYTCPSVEDGSLLLGWSSVTNDGWVDHCTNSVHDDHERVVAWLRLAEGETPNFLTASRAD